MNRLRNRWRRLFSFSAKASAYALTGLALVPLGLVLWYTVANGWPAATQISVLKEVGKRTSCMGASALVDTRWHASGGLFKN